MEGARELRRWSTILGMRFYDHGDPDDRVIAVIIVFWFLALVCIVALLAIVAP